MIMVSCKFSIEYKRKRPTTNGPLTIVIITSATWVRSSLTLNDLADVAKTEKLIRKLAVIFR